MSKGGNQLYNFETELGKYGLTKETYEQCLSDISEKVLGDNDMDWADIIDKFNLQMAKDTLRKASSQSIFGNVFVLEYFKYKSEISDKSDIEKIKSSYQSESSINKDGTFSSNKLIQITEDDLKSPDSLLKAHGFDVKEWELVSAKNNIWNVYSKQDGINELYSSKIIIKPRSGISLEDIEKFYLDLLKNYCSPTVKRYEDKTGLLFELPIMDLHLGKFSTSDIVGEEYNTEIARECFNKVIDTCISRLNNTNTIISEIVFPIGQDFFHFDTVSSTTSGGTPQDTDRKHQTLFKDGVTLLIDGIKKLSCELNAPIKVFCVPGNHDSMTSYHAVMSLWCYFHENENVTVDITTSPRKYTHFGKCLIGHAHGQSEKKRIEKIMQVEAAELWGKSVFREFHLGHLHSEQVSEDGGIIIRHLSSVSGTDAWHHNSGYVGAIRKCSCFLWDSEYGLDSIFNVVI